ncbi:sulfite exporter TauE/SafE family protein [Variovorax boronicumulans]|uniref:sulfite exporter TauE/SafE family protein n=1 Tax=Variovorax boronicumulans TaxID=436515 RepID=UPI0027D8B08D|nr:TSUP family transporter [Variovorax boronicumulans]
MALGLFIGVVAVTIGGGATAGVPLLLLMGHSAAQSIATVKFALLGSFVTGSLAHRGDAAAAERKAMPWAVWPLAVVGSAAGSLLVVGIDDRVLKIVVALLMVVILWITHRTDFSQRRRDAHARLPSAPVGVAMIFGLCVYSGFFGAGFGTFLIFALMRCYGLTFGESASVMTRINLLVVGASVTTFISSGVVDFRLGIPLFVGCAAGGWLGAWVARVTNPKRMKAAFQAFTLLLGAKLLWEAWAAG